ncbi:MAG TPA: cytochrome c [Terriglobales bacterium]|jgi:mono/diheme cytochrome c family protein|nr:cytochrome c [Terriglobales bacterium]
MRIKILFLTAAMALGTFVFAAAKPSDSNIPVARDADDAENMRVEGEHRFKSNCGRCHAAPHKFPPRMMATIVRHMRVRATITDEDMRYILYYMTQ